MMFKTRYSLVTLKTLLQSKSQLEPQSNKLYIFFQNRSIVKVRLKWVKNRSLDHIIDTETDLKAAGLLKDAIKRYPTLFNEFPHAQYANLPCFRLTDTALLLDSHEQTIHQSYESDTVERLCRVLMMMKSQTLPLQSLHPLKWDLGLPDNFEKALIPKYPDHFQFAKAPNGTRSLRLVQWHEEFAVSALQRSNETKEKGKEYREFKSGHTALTFPMSFPKGYGGQKKVRAWMEEFHKLPYISPYEDSRRIEPNSELMEKRVVGVLHELLSLTIHKKTKRNYLRSLRDELILPHKFTRLFTRYPGIFYLSLKCKTTTVALREAYRRGKLANPHPLARLRDKFYHVMRTGLLYRDKGVKMIPQEILTNDVEDETEGEESEEEEVEMGDDCYEETSEIEDDSDEE
ncbi:hypothetical protein OIU85_017116 [Salix viminalis]|uniref:PORR domain-containing protein n=1 Tax=Salix viminalis TaxID=40686 RepID=A0A9Q0V7F7_SALVM|nr:hypothetical protein OIU85_017116 [Salix viminalis]